MGNCISPLRRSIRDRNAKKVEELLIEAGPSAPDYINEDYTADCFLACLSKNTKSPLHTAMSLQCWDIVWILLKYGADPECLTYEGQTPLHIASRQNNVTLIKHLIEDYKVDVGALDDCGHHAIHIICLSQHAIMAKDISALEYFKEKGILSTESLNLPDNDGNTPLHIAAANDNVAAVEYLINLGADQSVTNDMDETALDKAQCKARDLLGKS